MMSLPHKIACLDVLGLAQLGGRRGIILSPNLSGPIISKADPVRNETDGKGPVTEPIPALA
jgi:hypothetical protein